MIELEDVIEAYFDCRKHKRNTYNQLEFEMDYERNCLELWQEIVNRTYQPGRSIVFVVEKPVCREVFAATFRDRVVHHLIARRILPLLQERFHPESYSTQEGKGTLYGVKRVEAQIRECSHDYTQECWVMKLDIKSFFMSLPKDGLYDAIRSLLLERYNGDDLDTLLWLLKITIYNSPEKNCIRKSPKEKWKNLPHNKSLFHSDGMHGLPIGNFTSQLLALLFLDPLDHLITGAWGIRYYGRYVDDMTLIDESKDRLLEVREKIRRWLADHGLTLHPKKMYLQPARRGLNFIGGNIRPGGLYLSRRTIGFFFGRIHGFNLWLESGVPLTADEQSKMLNSLNSYFGMMRHYRSRQLFRRAMRRLSPEFFRYFHVVLHETDTGLAVKAVPVSPDG